MKLKITGLFFLLFGLLISCQTKKKDQQQTKEETPQEITTGDNSQNALDWAGTYEGILPCADCPGIETTLILNNEETYQIEQVYQERAVKNEEAGRFEWDATGGKITLYNAEDQAFFTFQIGEGNLFLLDENGERIKGELEDSYTLQKTK